ncbi:MAG TPA: VOC family protein [Alphaproteobacteria bacterium]|nr:VOC family protein [Alphaproteobacteria bacterium]
MAEHLHHVHIFAADIDATIAWWRDMLGAEVAVDTEMAGARNVFTTVGSGRLHLYDQPPKAPLKTAFTSSPGGAIHHIGIRSDDLPALAERMRARGATFRSEIREFGWWRYLMVSAPDGVLLELFAADGEALGGPLADYFNG